MNQKLYTHTPLREHTVQQILSLTLPFATSCSRNRCATSSGSLILHFSTNPSLHIRAGRCQAQFYTSTVAFLHWGSLSYLKVACSSPKGLKPRSPHPKASHIQPRGSYESWIATLRPSRRHCRHHRANNRNRPSMAPQLGVTKSPRQTRDRNLVEAVARREVRRVGRRHDVRHHCGLELCHL
jgi:hypothetical protein